MNIQWKKKFEYLLQNRQENEKIIEIMEQTQGFLSYRDKQNNNTLIKSIKYKNYEISKKLIIDYQVNVKEKNNKEEDALQILLEQIKEEVQFQRGRIELVKIIVESPKKNKIQKYRILQIIQKSCRNYLGIEGEGFVCTIIYFYIIDYLFSKLGSYKKKIKFGLIAATDNMVMYSIYRLQNNIRGIDQELLFFDNMIRFSSYRTIKQIIKYFNQEQKEELLEQACNLGRYSVVNLILKQGIQIKENLVEDLQKEISLEQIQGIEEKKEKEEESCEENSLDFAYKNCEREENQDLVMYDEGQFESDHNTNEYYYDENNLIKTQCVLLKNGKNPKTKQEIDFMKKYIQNLRNEQQLFNLVRRCIQKKDSNYEYQQLMISFLLNNTFVQNKVLINVYKKHQQMLQDQEQETNLNNHMAQLKIQ